MSSVWGDEDIQEGAIALRRLHALGYLRGLDGDAPPALQAAAQRGFDAGLARGSGGATGAFRWLGALAALEACVDATKPRFVATAQQRARLRLLRGTLAERARAELGAATGEALEGLSARQAADDGAELDTLQAAARALALELEGAAVARPKEAGSRATSAEYHDVESHPGPAAPTRLWGLLLFVVLCTGAAAASVAETTHNCVMFDNEAGDQTIKLQAWGPDAILLTATPHNAAAPPTSYPSALLPRADTGGGCRSAGANFTALANGNLRATLDAATGLLSYRRVSDGALLLREAARRTFSPSAAPNARGYFAAELSFAGGGGGGGAANPERFYGLGQHNTGALNNANRSFPFQPENTEILVPVLMLLPG